MSQPQQTNPKSQGLHVVEASSSSRAIRLGLLLSWVKTGGPGCFCGPTTLKMFLHGHHGYIWG